MPDDTPNKTEQRAVPDPCPGALAEVRILNDDVTPMHFVVDMVRQVLGKDFETAERIMLETHHEGAGVCGIYPLDAAREHEHPLQCVLARSSSISGNGE